MKNKTTFILAIILSTIVFTTISTVNSIFPASLPDSEGLTSIQPSKSSVPQFPIESGITYSSSEQYSLDEFKNCSKFLNSYYTGEGCRCKVGFIRRGQQCVGINENYNGQYDSNGENNKNYSQSSDNNNTQNKTIVVINNTVPIQTQAKCLIENEQLNSKANVCQCKQGYGYHINSKDNKRGCVICSIMEGYYLIQGKCNYCGEQQLYDQKNVRCMCKDGWQFEKNNKCILKHVQPSPVPVPIPNNTSNNKANENPSTPNKTVQPVSNNVSNIACASLLTQPNVNTANIYVSIQLSQEYKFNNEKQMQAFIKQDFPDTTTKPSSIYCNQNQNNLKIFECLMLYPIGVPNKAFNMSLSYQQKNGEKCNLNVTIDTLPGSANSLRKRN